MVIEFGKYSLETELSELLYDQEINALIGLLQTIKVGSNKYKFKPSFVFGPSLSSRLKKLEVLRKNW